MKNAQTIIEAAWDDRANVTLKTRGDIRKAVDFALDQLDSGKDRVAEKVNGEWKFKARRVEMFYFVPLSEGWAQATAPGKL